MFTSSSCSSAAPPAEGLLTGKAVLRDDESRLAATLRRTHGGADATRVSRNRNEVASPSRKPPTSAEDLVIAEILHAVEARLPGRVRELKVDVEPEQFVLRGVSSSYYVKQVAGHLAMTAMEACILGRLVNEIEVHSIR
jgi:hypothetical protein